MKRRLLYVHAGVEIIGKGGWDGSGIDVGGGGGFFRGGFWMCFVNSQVTFDENVWGED
jgi:hypothetical protein